MIASPRAATTATSASPTATSGRSPASATTAASSSPAAPANATLPADYVNRHVELAFASTAYGAQGETVDSAHLVVGEATGAAAAYVGMTRGRHRNVAHLVADSVDDARQQWIEVFGRDRADLGPGHAATRVDEDIERYGAQAPRRLGIAAGRGTGRSVGGGRRSCSRTRSRPVGPGIGR